MLKRCAWCGEDPLYRAYHDEEWGVPVHDDRKLFEMLILEGAQAGLSWLTILKKRDNYRQAFDHFDATKISGYGAADLARLFTDPGIVRNRRKIESAVKNAQRFLALQEEYGSFATFLWSYVDGKPQQNVWHSHIELPASTKTSAIMSKELKQRGFNFVGPTICYALMQSIGMVNDHLVDCFRYDQLRQSI